MKLKFRRHFFIRSILYFIIKFIIHHSTLNMILDDVYFIFKIRLQF